MQYVAPEGFTSRAPGAERILRSDKVPTGPDEAWCGDGHEKLMRTFGVGVYAFVDDATGYYLEMKAMPNPRLQEAVTWCFLDLVERTGGTCPVYMYASLFNHDLQECQCK